MAPSHLSDLLPKAAVAVVLLPGVACLRVLALLVVGLRVVALVVWRQSLLR